MSRGTEGAITIDKLKKHYVDFCLFAEVQPIAENVLLQELRGRGVTCHMANIIGADGYRFRPMVYVLRPVKATVAEAAATSRERRRKVA